MDQLVKRMLPISSRLTPVNRTRIAGDLGSIKCNMLAIALHCQLLEISGESLQILFIGKDRNGLCTKEIVVPDSQQPHKNRQVALKGSCTEVLVHLVETIQHAAKVIWADRYHR